MVLYSKLDERKTVRLGSHWAYNYLNDPKRLSFVLSRYRLAAQMSSRARSVLELGCSDGIGATTLKQGRNSYLGIDLDKKAIQHAIDSLSHQDGFDFIYNDFMGKEYGSFDAVVSLDVIEHIHKEHEAEYLSTIWKNCHDQGVVIIGTPNITAAQYASAESNLGHVNLFSQQRLCDSLSAFFHSVFPFGMNDELPHCGYANMSHYIFAIGCNKK